MLTGIHTTAFVVGFLMGDFINSDNALGGRCYCYCHFIREETEAWTPRVVEQLGCGVQFLREGGQLQLSGFLSHWIKSIERRASEDDVIRIHSE